MMPHATPLQAFYILYCLPAFIMIAWNSYKLDRATNMSEYKERVEGILCGLVPVLNIIIVAMVGTKMVIDGMDRLYRGIMAYHTKFWKWIGTLYVWQHGPDETESRDAEIKRAAEQYRNGLDNEFYRRAEENLKPKPHPKITSTMLQEDERQGYHFRL